MTNNDGQKETKNTILLTMLTYPTHTYLHTYHVLLVNLTYIHTYMSLVLYLMTLKNMKILNMCEPNLTYPPTYIHVSLCNLVCIGRYYRRRRGWSVSGREEGMYVWEQG